MNPFEKEIAEIVGEKTGLGPEEVGKLLEVPRDAAMGDYAFPCFQLAKAQKKAPPAIAADLAKAVSPRGLVTEVKAAGPYVNFRVDRTRLAALVPGRWPANKKVIDVPLHKFLTGEGERRVRAVEADHDAAKRSITLVQVASRYADYTLLDVTIKTGRTHQIRVHLAHEGHAIVGDAKYGDFALNKALARGPAHFERMFLHARRLRFAHPATGAVIELESPLPAECREFLATLVPA